MTEIKQIYYIDPVLTKDITALVLELNRKFSLIADRLDKIEGNRGTLENIKIQDTNGKTIHQIGGS